ncbi:hypothetical protein AB5I39_03310 [Sphingomonas sp. MMS24-J45]|uniref:hypothetical protein n=1 Tax=Sphingomonas sp. MMS24-J45 TaxID=3238806 RepID=UPI0038504984
MSLSITLVAAIAANGTTPNVSDRWISNSDGVRCSLSRQIEVGTSQATLILSPDLTTSQTNGVLSVAEAGAKKASVTRFSMNPAQVAGMLDAKQLSVPTGKGKTILPMDGVEPALKNAATCRARLRDQWNIDQRVIGKIATPAQPINGADWLQPWDFPNVARVSAKVNDMTFLLAVSENGRIASCRTLAVSGSSDVADAACASVQRYGKFEPARDASGRAIGSWSVQRLVWRDPQYLYPSAELPASRSDNPISVGWVSPSPTTAFSSLPPRP